MRKQVFVLCGIGIRSRSGSQWVHRAFNELEDAQKVQRELNEICMREDLDAIYHIYSLIVE